MRVKITLLKGWPDGLSMSVLVGIAMALDLSDPALYSVNLTTNNTDWVSWHSKESRWYCQDSQGNSLVIKTQNLSTLFALLRVTLLSSESPGISNSSIGARTGKRHVVVILLSLSSQSVTQWYAIIIASPERISLCPAKQNIPPHFWF